MMIKSFKKQEPRKIIHFRNNFLLVIPPIGDKSSKSPVKGLNLKSDKSEYSPGPLPRLFIILNNLPSLSNINIFF